MLGVAVFSPGHVFTTGRDPSRPLAKEAAAAEKPAELPRLYCAMRAPQATVALSGRRLQQCPALPGDYDCRTYAVERGAGPTRCSTQVPHSGAFVCSCFAGTLTCLLGSFPLYGVVCLPKRNTKR